MLRVKNGIESEVRNSTLEDLIGISTEEEEEEAKLHSMAK